MFKIKLQRAQSTPLGDCSVVLSGSLRLCLRVKCLAERETPNRKLTFMAKDFSPVLHQFSKMKTALDLRLYI